MKNTILFGAMLFGLCFTIQNANAQLEVKTNGDVKATKNVEIGQSLTVTNNATVTNDINGKNVNISNNLVSKNINVTNNVSVGNKMEITDSLVVDNNAQVVNDLTVGHNITVSNNLNVTKDVQVNKNLKVTKNIAIGNANVNSLIGINLNKTAEMSGSTQYGIKSNIQNNTSMPTSSIFGIYSVADASPSNSIISGNQIVGVYGLGIKKSSFTNFTAGVAGMAHYQGGIGIYGGISVAPTGLPSSMPSGSSTYAGYFDGTVKINGTLITSAASTTSDLNQSENVELVSSSLADNIQLLTPVSYTLKQDTAWQYDKDAKELQGVHYGLIAQDVQNVFPELVYERQGILSINYTELIPLLIKQVQELSAEVDKLKAKQTK